MSELHQSYFDVIEIPAMELHKIVLGLIEVRKGTSNPDGLDCDLVDENDYTEWFKQ